MLESVSVQAILAIFLWTALGVYGFSSVWWLIETFVLSYKWKGDSEDVWGLDEIQVRILTVNAVPVVQQTVDAIPAGLTDVRVSLKRTSLSTAQQSTSSRRRSPVMRQTRAVLSSGHGAMSVVTKSTSSISTKIPSSRTSLVFRTLTSFSSPRSRYTLAPG